MAEPSFNQIIPELRFLAAADANHDFPKNFDKTLKHIGVLPDSLENEHLPFNEVTILNRILDFSKSTSEDELTKAFNTAYLGTNGNKELGWIHSNEGIKYKVKTMNVAAQNADSSRQWNLYGRIMFQWLNVHDTNNIAFTIDAQNVPFYEAFDLNSDEDPLQKTAYNYYTRECVNDPAGKTIISEKAVGKNVIVTNIFDYFKPGVTQNILYPHIPLEFDFDNNTPKNSLFYSKFDIASSSIVGGIRKPTETGKTRKDTKTVTMHFSTTGLNKKFDVMKGCAENAVGSISAVSKAIAKLTNKNNNSYEKDMYFFHLQQKRSGDWLQALSCLDMERFHVLSGTTPVDVKRIFLVTHDRILLAYSLLMGIDVLYTHYENSDKSYRLAFFYKAGDPVPENEQLANQIQNLKSSKSSIRIENYTEIKNIYNSLFNKTRVNLENALASTIQSLENQIPINYTTESITVHIKNILKRSLELSSLFTLAPFLKRGDETFYRTYIDPQNKITIPPNTNLKPIIAELHLYCKNIEHIRKSFGGQLPLNFPLSLDENNKITTYFIRQTSLPPNGRSVNKDMYNAVDQIMIFPKQRTRIMSLLFRKKDEVNSDPRRGAGVISYLDSVLNDEYKHVLNAHFKYISDNRVFQAPFEKDLPAFCESVIFLLKVSTEPFKNPPRLDIIPTENCLDCIAKSNEALPELIPIDKATADTEYEIGKNEEGKNEEAAAAAVLIEISQAVPVEAEADEALIGGTPIGTVETRDDINTKEGKFQVTDYVPAIHVLSARAQERFDYSIYIRPSIINALPYNALPYNDETPIQKASNKRTTARKKTKENLRRVTMASRSLSRKPELTESRQAPKSKIQPKQVAISAQVARRTIAAAKAAETEREETTEAEVQRMRNSNQSMIGGNESDHNPHTTFYLLLRDLSFRLSQEEQYNYVTCLKLSHIIQTIYKFEHFEFISANQISEYDYINQMEHFILKEIAKHPGFYKAEVQEIILNFLDSYYAMDEIPDSYIVKEVISKEQLNSMINLSSLPENEDCIQDNFNLMEHIIFRVRIMERPTIHKSPIAKPVYSYMSSITKEQPLVNSRMGGKRRTNKRRMNKRRTIKKRIVQSNKQKTRKRRNKTKL